VIPSRVDDRKLEAAFLEALHVEDEARAIPEEDLHLVLGFADEDEEVAAIGIVSERAFDDGALSVVTKMEGTPST
jgi:hypothetical protein